MSAARITENEQSLVTQKLKVATKMTEGSGLFFLFVSERIKSTDASDTVFSASCYSLQIKQKNNKQTLPFPYSP